MKFKWVQLSDIHFAYKDYQTNRMRIELLQRLKDLRKEGPVDSLFITGDLTDKSHPYTELTGKCSVNHSFNKLIPHNYRGRN